MYLTKKEYLRQTQKIYHAKQAAYSAAEKDTPTTTYSALNPPYKNTVLWKKDVSHWKN